MNVKKVLIIASTGHPVISYGVGKDELFGDMDEDLISALISAIKMFSNTFSGEEISVIEMTKIKWVILPSLINGLIFVMIAEYSEDSSDCRSILEDIRDKVLEEHKDHLTMEMLFQLPNSTRCGIEDLIKQTLFENGIH